MPKSIRKTARNLSINSDAKYRFERGVDPNSVIEGLEVAVDLITKFAVAKPVNLKLQEKVHRKIKN